MTSTVHQNQELMLRVKSKTQGNSISTRQEIGKGSQRCERRDRVPLRAVLVGQGTETGSPEDPEWVGRVLQPPLHQPVAGFTPPRAAQSCPHGQGQCRGSPARRRGCCMLSFPLPGTGLAGHQGN